ncbi:MAG: ankyrin repeat domain-containing protein, partial [Cyclobacteriaceae bacterium]|nr:ankyrin repeat domain-containing protein [Cyclobacteriaceae bacterium]
MPFEYFLNKTEEKTMKRVILSAVLIMVHMTIIASAEPIVEAAKNGDLQTVKMILAKDPTKLNSTDKSKYTALHWACIRAHWDVAKFLIEKGADLNVVGGDGGTQINWAVHHDNVEIIKLMIEKGAKLNIRNQWGMTELHTAIWRGCIHVVEYLLDHGSDPM